ncbi:MAG: hypothetical protein ACI3ZB_11680 [Prevotella sp.]
MKKYIKTLLVAVLTIASSVSATAKSSNLQAELVSGEEYYLYSPGHGKYVNGDGAWGTQAIMSDTPMRIVMKDEGDGYWSIKTKDITVSGKNYTTENKFFKRENAGSVEMIFVDGSTNKPYKWKITNMGNLQYKIQAHDATGDVDACMGVRNDISNTQTNSIVYGPYFNQTYSENDCLWEFIKVRDKISLATQTNPLDFSLQSPTCDNKNGWAVDGTLGEKDLLKVGDKDQEGFSKYSNIEYWKGANEASGLTGRMYYRLSSMPAGTYRLTADIYEKDLDVSTITTRPDFFFGDTRMEFASSMARTTKVFYAQHKADGDIDFGFTLPAGKIWVIIDDLKLEAIGGPNAILTNVETNATYPGNYVTGGTCANYNLVDDKYGMNNITTAFTANNLTYNRVLTSGTKTTVCLPFSLTAEEAAELGSFYTLKGLADNTLSFEIASVVEANKPYLFVPKTEAFNSFTNKTIAITPESLSQVANDNTATMVGTLQRTTLRSNAEATLYAYNDGNFVKISSTADAYLPAFRAYISVPASTAAKLAIRLDDKTTGISMGTAESEADAPVYTVDGLQVTNPVSKGVYIKNGKKFVVK